MDTLITKSGLINFFVITALTLAASYFIVSDKVSTRFFSQSIFSQSQNQFQLADLSDAQVDMIIAVKNAMHEANIQHD